MRPSCLAAYRAVSAAFTNAASDANAAAFTNAAFDAAHRAVQDLLRRTGSGGVSRADQAALIYDSPVAGSKCVYTYGQLRDEVAALAAVMQDLGIAKGDRVAVFMQNCPQFVVAFYAVLRADAVVRMKSLGYDPRLYVEENTRLRDVIEAINAALRFLRERSLQLAFGAQDLWALVATTNRAGDLDPALLSPGRFDRIIHFDLPPRADRVQEHIRNAVDWAEAEPSDADRIEVPATGCYTPLTDSESFFGSMLTGFFDGTWITVLWRLPALPPLSPALPVPRASR